MKMLLAAASLLLPLCTFGCATTKVTIPVWRAPELDASGMRRIAVADLQGPAPHSGLARGRPGGGTCAAELRSSGCPNDARTVASRHSFSGSQRRCQVAGGTGSPGGIRRFARRRSHLRGRCRLVSNDRQPAAQGRRPDSADRRPYGKCPRSGRIAPQPARKAVASRRGEEFKARSLRGSRPRSSLEKQLPNLGLARVVECCVHLSRREQRKGHTLLLAVGTGSARAIRGRGVPD